MTPDQLTAASFSSYPPKARQFAIDHLALLRQLPVSVAPAFLREIIVFDWRFPAERRTFERQCAWLESLPPEQRAHLLAPFQQISIPPALAAKDWVRSPQPFLEQLTAYLWSSSQIDLTGARRRTCLRRRWIKPRRKIAWRSSSSARMQLRPARSSFASSRRTASRCITCNGLTETPRQLHASAAAACRIAKQHRTLAGTSTAASHGRTIPMRSICSPTQHFARCVKTCSSA